jgi:WD40 repeat protein
MRRPFHRILLLVALGMTAVAGLSLFCFIYSPFRRPRDPLPEAVVAELSGRRNPILSCVFSPDSATLATGNSDGTVRIWDTSTFQLSTVLPGHSLDVVDIAFSPDGKLMLSAGADRSVRVWDTTTWQTRTVIGRRPLDARAVSFSPDGSRFALAGGKGQGSIQAYESATGRLAWDRPGTDFEIWTLAYSPDGRILVTPDDGGNATLWDAQTGQVLDTHRITSGGICAIPQVAFGANPSELVVLKGGGSILQWNLAAKRLEWEERSENGLYTGFAFSPDRKVFARMWRRLSDFYGEVQLLAGVRGEVLAAVKCRNSYLHSIRFSPDSKYIATVGEWDTVDVLIWDVEKIRALTEVPPGRASRQHRPGAGRQRLAEQRPALVGLHWPM